MRSMAKIWLRLRSLFRREAVDAELEEELRSHLERQIAQNIAAGMSCEEARYAALSQIRGRGPSPGAVPRHAQCKLVARPSSGYPIWTAHAAQVSRIHRRGRSYARPRNRRQHRHLQHGQRVSAPLSTGARRRTDHCHRGQRKRDSRSALGAFRTRNSPISVSRGVLWSTSSRTSSAPAT